MSAGGFAAPYTPRSRNVWAPNDDVPPPIPALVVARVAEQVRVRALLDAEGATDLLPVLGLED